MNQTDSSTGAEPEATDDTAGAGARSGRGYVSKAASSLRRGVESGAVTEAIGGIGILSGLRAFQTGNRKMGLARLGLGAGFLTVAAVQRRSRDRSGEPEGEEPWLFDTVPDADAVADEASGAGEEDHAAGGEDHAASEAAVATSDTPLDMEDVELGSESDADTDAEPEPSDQREADDDGVESESVAEAVERELGDAGDEQRASTETTTQAGTDVGDGAETEEVDRLGEAAFDSQSRKVPAPQRAFNQGFLAHSSVVCWGIRASDGAVLIAQDYDVIEGLDGVKYVASSEIGKDVRELPIPDAVLNHWDEMIRSGTAVTGGDDIRFVTTESLAADGLLRVLPSEWADDL